MADLVVVEHDTVVVVQEIGTQVVEVVSAGPQGIPGPGTWAGISDKPTVIAAGATQAEARTAIGAVADNDARLADPRTPTGGAGGVLSGTYPNPGFAVDMATQAELEAVGALKVDKVAGKALSTEDYTTAEKTKLAGVAAGAQVNTVTSVAGKTGAVTLAKTDVGLTNVDNTSDANKPVSTATQNALNSKEASITAGTTSQYWRGDKTWRDFFTDVRAATLTGLSTATNAVVAATDTVLAAIGKLQAQVSAKFDKTGGDVNGNINFTGTARRITGDFSNATVANRVMFQASTVNGNTDIGILPNGLASSAGIWAFNNGSDLANTAFLRAYINGATDVRFESGAVGGYSFLPITFHTGGAERMRIDTSGNVLATGGAIGYGAGAGGTVTQATSKSTNVTLNKPSGAITMNGEALAAGGIARFSLFNSYIAASDEISVWISDPSGTASSHIVWVDGVVNGACGICVKNITTGSLSLPVKIGFTVRKCATS